MCRQYDLIFECGHVLYDAHTCALSTNCPMLSSHNIIHIPSYCGTCILSPTFPTHEQQIFLSLATLDRLIEAEQIWGRLHRLYFGTPITDGNRPPNEKNYERLSQSLSEEDLKQLHYWLQLLKESRRLPQSWKEPSGVEVKESDKVVFITLLRQIIINEIDAEEASFSFLTADGTPKQQLLTKVQIGDLEEDRKECMICRLKYGESPDADEEAEFPVKLPCGHVFGEACIVTAFEQLGWKCPYCRADYDGNLFVLNVTPNKLASPWWVEWLKRPVEC